MRMKSGTVILDLRKPEEQLWKEVHSKNRWSVKKARKLGVGFEVGGDRDACYRLYLETCRRNLIAPMYPELFSSRGRLFTATHENRLAAFAVLVERPEDKSAELWLNASDYALRETQANSLLYWEFIRHYRAAGYETLDLGGIDLHASFNRGNDRFKLRWGGARVARETEVGLLHYVWWRWLRESLVLRRLKLRGTLLARRLRG